MLSAPRIADIVSTSAPSLSTTLPSTSAQGNEEAPSKAGPICARRLRARGVVEEVTMRLAATGKGNGDVRYQITLSPAGARRDAREKKRAEVRCAATGPRSRRTASPLDVT